MYEVLYGGQRFLTLDVVAETLVEYASVLAGRGRSDVVEIPVVFDGSPERCRLFLSSATPVAIVSTRGNAGARLPGADAAFLELCGRLTALSMARD